MAIEIHIEIDDAPFMRALESALRNGHPIRPEKELRFKHIYKKGRMIVVALPSPRLEKLAKNV